MSGSGGVFNRQCPFVYSARGVEQFQGTLAKELQGAEIIGMALVSYPRRRQPPSILHFRIETDAVRCERQTSGVTENGHGAVKVPHQSILKRCAPARRIGRQPVQRAKLI